MKVELKAVPELECTEAKVTERGVIVTPMFLDGKKGAANVASITIKNDGGKTLFQGVLRVSGLTGKPTISARGVPVQPAVDKGGKSK